MTPFRRLSELRTELQCARYRESVLSLPRRQCGWHYFLRVCTGCLGAVTNASRAAATCAVTAVADVASPHERLAGARAGRGVRGGRLPARHEGRPCRRRSAGSGALIELRSGPVDEFRLLPRDTRRRGLGGRARRR